jgi:hypothetical protein
MNLPGVQHQAPPDQNAAYKLRDEAIKQLAARGILETQKTPADSL